MVGSSWSETIVVDSVCFSDAVKFHLPSVQNSITHHVKMKHYSYGQPEENRRENQRKPTGKSVVELFSQRKQTFRENRQGSEKIWHESQPENQRDK